MRTGRPCSRRRVPKGADRGSGSAGGPRAHRRVRPSDRRDAHHHQEVVNARAPRRARVDSAERRRLPSAPCRCGGVRIAGPPRPRRPGAGSAAAPPPPAAPAGTSAGRSRPRSATAGSTGDRQPLHGDEIRAAGRRGPRARLGPTTHRRSDRRGRPPINIVTAEFIEVRATVDLDADDVADRRRRDVTGDETALPVRSRREQRAGASGATWTADSGPNGRRLGRRLGRRSSGSGSVSAWGVGVGVGAGVGVGLGVGVGVGSGPLEIA